MKKQIILFCFSVLFLVSCSQTNKMTEKDYLWMPYNGNEMLVFKSNAGETDTIFLLKKDTLLAYPEAQSINGVKYEMVAVVCKHSDPNILQKHRYLENVFFEVIKSKNRQAEIKILLSD